MTSKLSYVLILWIVILFATTEPGLIQNFYCCSTGEPEAEVSDVAPATAAAQSASDSGDAAAGTLLEVTFQRNPRQKHKFLEAEPKILGVHVKSALK